MITLRTKILTAFIAGMICALGVLFVRNFTATILFRLDRIEQYLTQQEMLRQMQRSGVTPQSLHPSHKGELSKPQQWKV